MTNSRSNIEFMSVRYAAYLFVFFLSLYLFINFGEGSDLRVHTRIVGQIDEGRIVVPHFLYHLAVYGISKISHISFFYVSCLVMATCIAATMLLIEKTLCVFLKDRYSDYFLLYISLALMLVSAIYFPLVNPYPYLGVWGPNPWHNPTFITARPFVLLSFWWYLQEIVNGTNFTKRFSLIRIAISLVLCTLIKPNFVLAFIPASFIFCGLYSDRKMQMWFKTGLLLLPVIGVLLFQYLFAYYYNLSGSSSVQFCFFDVWQRYAPSVPLAILQGTAFPLIVSAVFFSSLRKEKMLVFSWLLLVIGLAISVFLCETGGRAAHANFIWTYMFCLNILFICSTISLLRWISDAPKQTLPSSTGQSLCILFFLLHLYSGLYYVSYLIDGHVL